MPMMTLVASEMRSVFRVLEMNGNERDTLKLHSITFISSSYQENTFYLLYVILQTCQVIVDAHRLVIHRYLSNEL